MRILALFTLAALPALAQSPDLVRENTLGTDGQALVQLRNISALPAVAWSWESRRPGARNSEGRDSLTETALAPGAAIDVRVDGAVGECAWAVIYSDGSTAGDGVLLGGMLAARRAALAAIPELRELLETAVAHGERPESLRAKVHGKLKPSLSGPSGVGMNRAAVLVQTKLNDAKSVAEVAPGILDQLDRLRLRLEASKPPLQ